jgi:hypothetical protein
MAASVGSTGAIAGNGRLRVSTTPTTAPSSTKPGRAAQVGVTTRPNPTVANVCPRTNTTGPSRGGILRAAATSAMASPGEMAPTAARSTISSMRPALSSSTMGRVDTRSSLRPTGPTWTISTVGSTAI